MVITCDKCSAPAIGTLKGKVFLIDFCKEHDPLAVELHNRYPDHFELIYANEGDDNERGNKNTSEQV